MDNAAMVTTHDYCVINSIRQHIPLPQLPLVSPHAVESPTNFHGKKS